jgi:ATP-dependent protease HslVU (ClpYQ) peptidase subunit
VTVICAAINDYGYAIGGDSGAFGDSGLKMVSKTPKVFKVGKWLLGVAGSFRVVNAVSKLADGNPESVREVLMKELTGDVGEWSVLMVSAAGIYELAEDFSIIRFSSKYASIGAAADVATGALAVLHSDAGYPRDAVKDALDVANNHHILVQPPFKILSSLT